MYNYTVRNLLMKKFPDVDDEIAIINWWFRNTAAV